MAVAERPPMSRGAGLQIITNQWKDEPLAVVKHHDWNPKSDLGRIIKSHMHLLPPEAAAELIQAISRVVVLESELRAWKIEYVIERDGTVRPAYTAAGGKLSDRDLALVSRHLVTNNGVGRLVDCWQNLNELEDLKYHGIGTGSTAEAQADSALVTELTTQYNPDSTRATGSLTEGASANIFRTVATNTVDATVTIAEHGILSQSATGGGVLWDRSVLSPTSGLNSGESLQTQYDMTASAGG